MLSETLEPFWGCEAMDNGYGTEVQKLGTDGGLLSGYENSGSKVALETDRGEEGVG